MATRIRVNMNKKPELCRAIARDNAAEFKIINGAETECVLQTVDITPHANFHFEFPELPGVHTPESISHYATVSMLLTYFPLFALIALSFLLPTFRSIFAFSHHSHLS